MAAHDPVDEFERVQQRLTRARPQLSSTLSRAAAYMLEHPADVVTMSMREIARAAGIPAPNFSRLAARLGFTGYNALRDIYRRRVYSGKPIAAAAPAPPSRPVREDRELWEAYRNTATANLTAVFQNVDAPLIASVAREIYDRELVHVAATHASHHLVRYLHAIAGMASPSFRSLGLQGAAFGDSAVDIGARDALVCLASNASDDALVTLAGLARERGALVVGICPGRTSALTAVSDRVLLAPDDTPSFFASRLAALAVLEMLASFVALHGGQTAADRIGRIRRGRARFEQT